MHYKGYTIENDGSFGLKFIKLPGQGGTVPDILRGTYTSYREAIKAIDYYVHIRQEYENRPAPIKKVKLTPREV